MKKIYTTFLLAFAIALIANGQATQLTVRGYSQGYYQTSNNKMRAVLDPVNSPLICDTGTIELIDGLTNQTVQCLKTPVNTDGFATVSIPGSFTGQSFTVSMKFKNTFHLLSASPILMNGQPSLVDLSIPQNACCHFDTTHGVAKAYSGDVNYDGLVDVMDLTIWESDYHNNPNGYHLTDVNGDQIVDTLDLMIMEENSNNGYSDDYFSNCSAIATGIDGIDDQSVVVYPNPASSELNILCSQCSYNKTRLSILDVTGRVVINKSWQNGEKENVDVSSLTPGIYFINLVSDEGINKSRKIVVE